jgi:hypothetical protein
MHDNSCPPGDHCQMQRLVLSRLNLRRDCTCTTNYKACLHAYCRKMLFANVIEASQLAGAKWLYAHTHVQLHQALLLGQTHTTHTQPPAPAQLITNQNVLLEAMHSACSNTTYRLAIKQTAVTDMLPQSLHMLLCPAKCDHCTCHRAA